MRTRDEYDAFGPWIDEVHTVDDLPRLYWSSAIDPAAYRLVLKVPRNIESRDATPDMHLYDHLLAVGEKTLTVLSRRDDTYDTIHVPFDQIVAIEDSVALLSGRMNVHMTSGKTVSISYNGSARHTVQHLVRLLRRIYRPLLPETTPLAAGTDLDVAEPDLGAADIGLVTVYCKVVRKEPQMRLVDAVTRRVATPTSGRIIRALHRVWPVTLHASIIIADDLETQVIHRRHWFTRGAGPVYSLARTVLPRARITAIRLSPHERYERVQVVSVQAGAACLRFPTPTRPETDALLAPFAPDPRRISWISGEHPTSSATPGIDCGLSVS